MDHTSVMVEAAVSAAAGIAVGYWRAPKPHASSPLYTPDHDTSDDSHDDARESGMRRKGASDMIQRNPPESGPGQSGGQKGPRTRVGGQPLDNGLPSALHGPGEAEAGLFDSDAEGEFHTGLARMVRLDPVF